MDCAELLTSGGEVYVQFLLAFGATSTPLAWEAASYNSELRGGYSQIPPLNGIVWDHPHSPVRGFKSSRLGAFIFIILGRCGVLWFGTTKCTALKAVDGDTGVGGGGKEGICSGGSSVELS